MYIPNTLITASELNGWVLDNIVGRTLTLDLWLTVLELEIGDDTVNTYLTIIILDTVHLILLFG